MRVVRVDEFGPPQVLRVGAAEPPQPGPGQVLVGVEAVGVIYGDTIVRSGRYPLPLPWIPGTEVGGRVLAAGPDVDQDLTGQRVVATTLGNTGGYAEQAVAEIGNVFAVPDGLPLPQAIAVFQAGAVARGLLSAMRVQAGDSVLITAAAGRIGLLLVQLAKQAGAATVIGASSSEQKLAAVAEVGADVLIDYSRPDWVAEVNNATGGRGIDVVLDAIGGSIGTQALDVLADGRGRIGIYGIASGAWTSLQAELIARRGLTVIGPLGITFAKPPADQRADAGHALQAAAAGRLRTRVHATYPLERAAQAHADLEARRNIGAILLAP